MRVYRVIKYVNDNLNKSISAESTAEYFGYSKWYFCEAFKRYTGQTFVEYVRTVRMKRAAIDILDGKKVFDVALAYGYDTPSGFNKAFIKSFTIFSNINRLQSVNYTLLLYRMEYFKSLIQL